MKHHYKLPINTTEPEDSQPLRRGIVLYESVPQNTSVVPYNCCFFIILCQFQDISLNLKVIRKYADSYLCFGFKLNSDIGVFNLFASSKNMYLFIFVSREYFI